MLTKGLEDEILQNALAAFKKNVALPMEINTETLELPMRHDITIDKLLRIEIDNRELNFYAEVKTYVTNIAMDMKCFPGGSISGSIIDGIIMSIYGCREKSPYLASS